jgi:glycosyltransferase involved in cell wall biosynthesis
MKKKIGLFLSEEPAGGGKFQYSLSILEAMSALPYEDYEIVVAYTNELWLDYLKRHNFKHLCISSSLWDRIINRVWRDTNISTKWVRQVSPHIYSPAKIFLRQSCSLWVFPSHDVWSYKIPVISLAAMHDLMHRYERGFPEVSGHVFEQREQVYGNICRWANGLLVDSETGKQHVIESYGTEPDKVHILPFVSPKYIYAKHTPKDFDNRYNLPSKYFFYPAQFWEHKNHNALIRAAKLLKGTIGDLKLVFAGSKKNGYETTVQIVGEMGLMEDIVFLGYVPDEDVPELYRRARALIMPTFFGPTNIPPLEAFAVGCPVAVSNVYGMQDLVGDAAMVFDPKSNRGIADVMLQLWTNDDLCAALSARGYKRAREWNQDHFNQRFLSILEKLLN